MENIFQLNNPGVFGLIDEDNKTIFLVSSSNMLVALKPTLDKNINISDSSKIIVCETVNNRLELSLRYSYWYNYYSNRGYLVTSKKGNAVKLRIDLIEHFDSKEGNEALFYVKLIHGTSKALTVGIFNVYCDAETFVSDYYARGVYNLVTVNNKWMRHGR